MKKFFKEFKEFISQGNVLDLAVGVIIGAAFKDIVTSLCDNIIMPIIGMITGGKSADVFDDLVIGQIKYGKFLSAVINFLLMALIIFIIVKIVNKATKLVEEKVGLNEEAEEPAPTTKICPFCKMEIPIDAVKCGHCASEITEE